MFHKISFLQPQPSIHRWIFANYTVKIRYKWLALAMTQGGCLINTQHQHILLFIWELNVLSCISPVSHVGGRQNGGTSGVQNNIFLQQWAYTPRWSLSKYRIDWCWYCETTPLSHDQSRPLGAAIFLFVIGQALSGLMKLSGVGKLFRVSHWKSYLVCHLNGWQTNSVFLHHWA